MVCLNIKIDQRYKWNSSPKVCKIKYTNFAIKAIDEYFGCIHYKIYNSLFMIIQTVHLSFKKILNFFYF